MALLNYTTSIDAWKTVAEIQQLLARAGASHFSVRNEGGLPIGISFTIEYGTIPLNFSLPCNLEGIKNHMVKNKASRDRLVKAGKMKNIDEHSLNVGWRILKNWIESQTALVEIEMASIQEIFMQYLVLPGTATTLSDYMLKGRGRNLLTAGE
jgi:hypothetical protein